MQVRKPISLRPRRLAGAAGAAFLLLALSVPAIASDDNVEGWYALLDIALTQPNSLDQDLATVVDNAFSAPNIDTRLMMDNDRAASFRAGFGYSFGEALGSLQVSYWTFDNDDRRSGSLTTSTYAYVYPTVFGDGFGFHEVYFSSMYPAEFNGRSSTKASTLDIDYIRPMSAGEKLTVRWLAGLRVASFKEDVTFNGFESPLLAVPARITETRHLDSDAIGPRFGATAVFEFTDRFKLEGGMTISFLQADTTGSASRGDIGSPPEEVRGGSNDNVRGEIRDFDLRAVWRSGPVDYYLGYSVSTWDGFVAEPSSIVGDFSSSALLRDDIAFNSWHGGIVVRFGGSGLPF